MTNLDYVKKATLGNLAHVHKQQILYAYIQLHMENPGLHPDDHTYEGSGYEGWMAILTNYVSLNFKLAPDNFIYPTCFLLLPTILEELKEFHMSQLHTDPMNIQIQNLCDTIIEIDKGLSEGKVTTLVTIRDSLIKLRLYHTDMPVLVDCIEVLTWITKYV